jgi:hypothetical protein
MRRQGDPHRRTRQRRILLLVMVLCAALALPVATALPAAAAGCSGESCRGRDPEAMGCTASSTPGEKFVPPEIYVQLRYSAVCGTFWARFKKDSWNCCVQVTLRAEQQKRVGGVWEPWSYQDKSIVITATTGVWTAMNPDESNDRHRACVVEFDWCTGWVATG